MVAHIYAKACDRRQSMDQAGLKSPQNDGCNTAQGTVIDCSMDTVIDCSKNTDTDSFTDTDLHCRTCRPGMSPLQLGREKL